MKKLKKIALFASGFFPHRLPVTKKEFEIYYKNLFFAYDLPENDSYINAIAAIIMHLGPTTLYKSPFFFCLSVKKSMANQIAYNAMDEIREKAKAEKEAEVSAEAECQK